MVTKLSPLNNYLYEIFAVILCIFYGIAGILVSVHRFWQYEASYIDFGQYDTLIWKASRFQEPLFHHFIHGEINILGDHFTPSVLLLSPLYWITDRPEIILIAQAVAVALSGLVLFDISRIVLKDKILSIAILISYFSFVGLQSAVITEFHELTVMTLPFMLAFWGLLKKKIWLYFLFLVVTLGFKEVTFSLGIGFGIALILLRRDWRRIGVITIIISAIWGFLAFKIFIPHLLDGNYLYVTTLPDSLMGKFTALFNEQEKRHTLFYSFFSFSFLPIFSPEFWLLILQDYASRFLPDNFVTRWTLLMHYNAQSAVILSLASVYGMKRLLNLKLISKYKVIIGVLIIFNSVFIFRFILHGPFLLAINPAFYKHSNDFEFLNRYVRMIPKDASIMTQNNLATRFTHQDVKLITKGYNAYDPDYILIDNRPEQSPNNYFGSDDLNKILKMLDQDKKYKLIEKTGDQYLFQRKSL